MEQYIHNDGLSQLTFVAAGSVDDGKSTLIGRLLYDTKQIFDDQLEALEKSRDAQGNIDLSLLTDGLAAEREQKITIDVAYRYFSTPKRRFIIADVPGHEQYTRNMVTGASHASVALILIDARKGLLEQTKRHLSVASLLGIPHIAIVINKMDLVDFDESIFTSIKQDVSAFASKLTIADLQYIPASAYTGDMVVERGNNMSWYSGRTVLEYLEDIEIESDKNLIDFRFPVQYVVRPNQDYRGYCGLIESGSIRVGEEIAVLPSMKRATVQSITIGHESVNEAVHPQSVVIELDKEVDISRGEMIVRPKNVPEIGNAFEGMLFWLASESMKPGKKYILKHTTKQMSCVFDTLHYEFDIDTLHRKEAETLVENGIGKVTVVTQDDLFFDAYAKNKFTGSCIIIDDITKHTVGACIITKKATSNTVVAKQHDGAVLWFTGLSGSGKTTIADAVHDQLTKEGYTCVRLDGDILRDMSYVQLGFDERDRKINVDKAAAIAKMLAEQGVIVLASFISPYKDQREWMKSHIDNFHDVFVSTSLDVCEKRDVKGLYKKARAGEIDAFTGISDPYEKPENAAMTINTEMQSVEESAKEVISYIQTII